jgi:hypothetical protein
MFAASKTNSFVAVNNYEISRSLRINSADNAILTRTPATATNRKTWTWSAWIKRGLMSASNIAVFSSANAQDYLQFGSDYSLTVSAYNNINYFVATTQLFRDPSAWYHIVVGFDSTQATASNRIKLYVNGVQVTAFQTANYPTQNLDTDINNTVVQYIGTNTYNYFNGYMTEVNFIDGQQLTPSSFGETNAQTGVWQPKAFAGTYGTNGYYLNFSDNSNTTAATLGADYSGNGNNWTPNNFSVTAGAGNDSLVDSPTSYGTDTGVGGTVRGNYATYNPISKLSGGSGTATYSNGNLDFGPVEAEGSATKTAISTIICPSSGKWYWEVTPTTVATAAASRSTIGIMNVASLNDNFNAGAVPVGAYGYHANGFKSASPSNTGYGAYGATYTSNDVIGVALDMDAGTLVFYKNGASQGTAYTGLSGEYFPAVGYWITASINLGQRAFANTAPSGFKALCTQNLPTPTIGATTATQAGKYFNTATFTSPYGGAVVTGVGFQPDFTWNKARSTAESHLLFDAVRGNSKYLITNSTNAEATFTNVWTPSSDGFTLAAGALSSTQTYVAWNWKANGSGSTNTAGSITSTVSANTTSGFSVVTYSGNATAGSTVGHGLGVTPAMYIVKRRSSVGDWPVYHASLGATGSVRLNLTNAFETTAAWWNNTAPTSSVFTIGNANDTNGSGGTFVAYCFAEISGYSKAFSYTGNGSTDGPFVFCGFRPAYVMVKNSTSASTDWVIEDTTRSTTNVMDARLFANTNEAESSNGNGNIDFLSNGFKLRNLHISMNGSGSTYIYMAFASSPLKFSLAR